MIKDAKFKMGNEVIIQEFPYLEKGTTGFIIGYYYLPHLTNTGKDEDGVIIEEIRHHLTYIVDVSHAYVQQSYCQKAIVLMDYQLRLKEY
jgi:hypothetical protein